MRTFVNYVKFKLNEDAPAPPPAGGPPAGGSPPMGGGGPPPMGGPPMGGGGPPPMGGSPMGGPPMGGGAGGTQTPPATKIKSSNVWDALKKLFNPKESKK